MFVYFLFLLNRFLKKKYDSYLPLGGGNFLCFLEAFVLYLETWGGAAGGGKCW